MPDTTFARQFRRAAWPGLSRNFGESITYVPHNYFGETARANRSINAIVVRADDRESYELQILNDVTDGITSEEIDVGRDQISFEARAGETAVQRTITKLISHDNGMLVVECR